MSYLTPVKPSLGQLRFDLPRRLAEATVTKTDVSLEGLDYFAYTPAQLGEILADFENRSANVADDDWQRFMRTIHDDLYRKAFVYSKWNPKKLDVLVKAIGDYLWARR